MQPYREPIFRSLFMALLRRLPAAAVAALDAVDDKVFQHAAPSWVPDAISRWWYRNVCYAFALYDDDGELV